MKRKFNNLFYIFFPIILQSLLFFLTKIIEREPYNITTNVDKKIPYISFFVIFYVIWYALLILAPIIIIKLDNSNIKRYFFNYVMCSIISAIIYVAFPTIIIRQSNLSNDIFDCIVKFIYFVDTPAINCFPSFHVILCLLWIDFICLNKNINKKIRYVMLFINIGIILSTIFVKQHVLIDLIGSIIVVLVVKLIEKYFKKK